MQRNIVVVVLDSVRKDFFDMYASRLVDGADISISQCRAASNWSPPSHGAMVTGELPSVSGIHSHDPSYADVPIDATLFDALDSYYTFGISSNLFVSESYSFDKYFDDFFGISRDSVFARGGDIDAIYQEIETDGPRRYVEFLKRTLRQEETALSVANGLALKLNDVISTTRVPRLWDFGTRASLDHAENIIVGNDDGPVFGFMNLMETHNPHANNVFYGAESVPNNWSSSQYNTYEFNNHVRDGTAETEYIDNYGALYAESIEYVDRRLSSFIDRIQRQTERETTFVVTADHGENLGEPENDGLVGHIGNLSEALLHVPLLVFNPPEPLEDGDTGYVSHLDFKTVIEGLVADEMVVPRRDRVPAEVVGSAPPAGVDNYDYWDRMQRAVYGDDRKYVWDSDSRSVYRFEREVPGKQERIEAQWPADIESEFFETPLPAYKAQFSEGQRKEWGDNAPVDRLKELGYL
ncbi:sulfatase-like hydrolase/transferase [Haloarcula laminariae]|uniref:sulfatase-like hydrolase/transferase n=1 Tax=Haloarcula laminariae TaxID=2961577 RepID=UPI00240629DB|nr:sulfatase-like hydrolase/transferase [Halomicroarcula sp. FL173]